jgi:hypothetical protein
MMGHKSGAVVEGSESQISHASAHNDTRLGVLSMSVRLRGVDPPASNFSPLTSNLRRAIEWPF